MTELLVAAARNLQSTLVLLGVVAAL